MKPHTDYEQFESSSVENRRLLREEELILEVTIALSDAMERAQLTKSQLAARLGKTPGFITQILSGGRNLTLRTVADVADAVDGRVCVHISRREDLGILIAFEEKQISDWGWARTSVPQIKGKVSIAPGEEVAA